MITIQDSTSGQKLEVRDQDLRRIVTSAIQHLTRLKEREGKTFPPSDAAALRAALDMRATMRILGDS